MRVLFLSSWYPSRGNPNHGIFVRDQAIALSKFNKVQVVSARIDYSSFGFLSFRREENSYQDVAEISITVKKSFPVFNQLNFFIVVIYATLKIAKTFKPDIVHGNIGYPGAFWSWVVSKFLKVQYVITEHTKITNNFRSPFHKFLTLFGLKRAAIITAVSGWHAAEIKSFIGKDVIVMGNIIRTRRFNEVKRKPAGQQIHFGILGGLDTTVKGIDLLLRACAQIQDDYVLHIGGTGKLLITYQDLASELGIKDKCVFHGFVESTHVPDFLSQLHFLVSASKRETFGMIMAEAMAAGLPVVATDSGGSAELITKENGILVINNDVAALAAGIKSMIANYAAYEPEMIKKSVDRYSEASFIEKAKKLYERILVNTPG
jgi:glycosyltransferase involved in cell wall biosynthesis